MVFSLAKSVPVINTFRRAGLEWQLFKNYGGHFDFGWERGGFLKEIDLEAGWEKEASIMMNSPPSVPAPSLPWKALCL